MLDSQITVVDAMKRGFVTNGRCTLYAGSGGAAGGLDGVWQTVRSADGRFSPQDFLDSPKIQRRQVAGSPAVRSVLCAFPRNASTA